MLDTALDILKIISDNGYEAYIVGGFVRDHLLGINSDDIDITTNMPVREISKIFSIDDKTIKHGSFVLNYNKFTFEITLFRKEISYLNQRHPEIELVNSYQEDYIRRDFTINALAYDFNMDLIDFCDGVVDLHNKQIKTIRESNLTFVEDPVRILRAIYFRNKLGLEYEANTYKSILNNVQHIESISHTRLNIELSKMISIDFDLFINDLIDTNAFKYIKLGNTISFIKNNKVKISCFNDILSICYYLGDGIKEWPISSVVKKEIMRYVDVCKSNFSKRILFDYNSNDIKNASIFLKLINNSTDVITKYNNLNIKNIKEIDFDFSLLSKFIDKSKFNKMKEEIINNILSNDLDNEYNAIIEFINK